MEQFRKIMSQLAPVLEAGKQYKSISNPLLPGNVPEELKEQQLIREDKTIFAQFTETIVIALQEQEEIRKLFVNQNQEEAKQVLNPKEKLEQFGQAQKIKFLE